MKCKGCGTVVIHPKETNSSWHIHCAISWIEKQANLLKERNEEITGLKIKVNTQVEEIQSLRDVVSRVNYPTAPPRYQPSGPRGAIPDLTANTPATAPKPAPIKLPTNTVDPGDPNKRWTLIELED